ncbi:type II secretion system F family protein [Dendrosporobacter sp. 1207_IL3150]|uniref:type II secretion system F family protein n=1 Tax=Dendrosporobacter sp. 1207_IL3150 TaxID=3084054 RepID=UPI002FDB36B6
MAKTFAYKAKDRSGQLLSGTIVAENQAAVATFIREKGYFITQIKEQKSKKSLIASINNLKPVKLKDLAVVCWQFSTMINAGMSLITALNTIIEQTDHPKLKDAFKDVLKKVQEGESLSHAMSDHPKIFPNLMINMIEAGEVGGVLDEVLARLATHYEKQYKMNEKVKSAMTYPAVVLTMAALAVAFILTFVLPTFMKMFEGMKTELPLPTKILILLSNFMQNYWPVLLLLVVAIILGLVYLYKIPKYRGHVDSLSLRLPVFGILIKKIAIARFSRTFGTLLRGGVPIITALEVVKKTTDSIPIVNALTTAQISIREGLGLSTPLGSSNIFTPLVIQMVAVGEETGELDKMLDKIADFYESEVDDSVNRLNSLLEPILIGVLGVIIGAIVISVALPMFDVITTVHM